MPGYYQFECSSCKNDTKFVIPSTVSYGTLIRGGCSECKARCRLLESKCQYCEQTSCVCLFKEEAEISPDFTCPHCHLVSERSKPKKPVVPIKNRKRINLWTVLESLYSKKYPKYAWSCVETCPTCNTDTVWYEFTKEHTKKYCSMCGEIPKDD